MPHLAITGDFDFLQAKIHGLRSRLYELERLDGLCDLTTIAQLWHRLYPDIEASDHHALQRRLLADHVATLEIIRGRLPERLAPFYTWVLRRYQIENLKVILRGWKAHEPLARIALYLAPLPGEFALRAQALLAASSLADFLLLVPLRELRLAAEKAAGDQIETGDTFFVETAFDAAYYRGLHAQHQGLPGEHRTGTETLVRMEIATYNILTLFRLKLSYNVPFEQTRQFLIDLAPHPFRLERIYDYPDFRDMLPLVPLELLPRDLLEEIRDLADLERALWERLLRVANRRFYRSINDLGAVVAYTLIKRIELGNLIRVIEGVRYGMDRDEIKGGLIRLPQAVAS